MPMRIMRGLSSVMIVDHDCFMCILACGTSTFLRRSDSTAQLTRLTPDADPCQLTAPIFFRGVPALEQAQKMRSIAYMICIGGTPDAVTVVSKNCWPATTVCFLRLVAAAKRHQVPATLAHPDYHVQPVGGIRGGVAAAGHRRDVAEPIALQPIVGTTVGAFGLGGHNRRTGGQTNNAGVLAPRFEILP